MNDTTPTDSPVSPEETNEPTVPATEPKVAEAPVEPAAEPAPAEAKAEPGSGGKPALDAAKEKARAAAEAIKAHDFKGDARKMATGAKNLWKDLRKHDYKTEIRETFAKAKKDPSSLWKKPETPRPGKDLAIAGLAVAAAGLFLLLVTSGAFIGSVCLVLGLVALLAGVLGLATEGRSLAFAGTGAGLLAVLLSIAQIHAATQPDPRDELVRLLTAHLARVSDRSVSQKDVEDLLARLEAGKWDEAEQRTEDLADAVSKLQSLTSTLDGGAAEAVASGLGQLVAGGSIPDGGGAADVVASGSGQLPSGGSRPAGGPVGAAAVEEVGPVAPFSIDNSRSGRIAAQQRMLDDYRSKERNLEERIRAAEQRNDSTTVESLKVQLANTHAAAESCASSLEMMRRQEQMKRQLDDQNREKAQARADAARERVSPGKHGVSAPEEPPAGPSGKRIDEVLPVLEEAKIETRVVTLPNNVRLLLSKLPDGTFMGTFEVTQDQWLAVMGGENPSAEDNVGDDHPVDSVWPSDCLDFVAKLNNLADVKKAGLQFRIPSEEEWETACLAGSRDDFGKRLDGTRVTKTTFGEIAWCSANLTRPADIGPLDRHPGISHAVGRKQPNAFGLYDMHGNVGELVVKRPDGHSSKRAFASKGGNWYLSASKASDSAHVTEKGNYGSGQKPKPDITLGLRVAASVLDKDIPRILAAAEKVVEDGGAAFFGFYPGMPEADATKLAGHYGLALGDDAENPPRNTSSDKIARVEIETDPATGNVIRIQFNIEAFKELTKESYNEYGFDNFQKFHDAVTKFTGPLECIHGGRNEKAPNVAPGSYLYRRDAGAKAVSLEKKERETPVITLEDSAAVAALVAARMAAANNARIEAVEPVLNNAGIKTKTIELPGGVKLLLTLLPNERYLGTFEVTQAQYASLMGTNVSQYVGADLPVDSVSVQDCLDFIAKANELQAVKEEDLRFRLPSIADWSDACRAGTEGDYTRTLDGTDVTKDTLAALTTPPGLEKSNRGPHSVGAATPNAFGFYDMFGNVSEWVADKLQDDPNHPDFRFHMGGSWSTSPGYIKPIRADDDRARYSSNYESDDPVKSHSMKSRGFRVSVVWWPREIQRAKDEAAKAYALSNNGRIDAVKPVLEEAGIETKEVELPGDVRMLLNKTPDGSWAAAFEITQAQWKSLLHENPSSFQGDPLCTDDVVLEIWRSWGDKNPERLRGTGLPVDKVSSKDCQTFIARINELPGVRDADLTFRLPTQDEWLYVALAGAKSAYAKPLGGGDASVDQMGWNKENVETPKSPRLQIVGQKQPNAFGLYDVHGNVAECAESRYSGRRHSIYGMGGSVGTTFYNKSEKAKNLALRRPIGGEGEKLEEYLDDRNGSKIPDFTGFRLVATEGGVRHLVDPEMAAANNARIDAVKPVLDAQGIETKILDLPGGVKLLLNKLPGGFWAGAFEVTQAQFLSILGENPSIVLENRRAEVVFKRPWLYRTGDRPVDNVGKGAAEAFLRELSALPCAKDAGLAFHLPFLEVWEQYRGAQRKKIPLVGGGKSDPYLVFPGGKTLLDMAWVGPERGSGGGWAGEARIVLDESAWSNLSRERETGDTQRRTEAVALSQPVGTKEPNPYGLYDMLGNVWEWTSTTKFELKKPRDEEWKKLHTESEIRGAEAADEADRHWFVTTGASFMTDYVKGMYKKSDGKYTRVFKAGDGDEIAVFFSLDLRNEKPAHPPHGALFDTVGFRVWGSETTRDPSAEPSSANAAPN